MKRETWSFEGGSRWRGGLALVVVLLLGALLRFHALTQKSLWDDEIFSFNALGIYRLGQPVAPPASLAYNAIAYYHDDNHPPLFFLLFGIWLKLFGASALAARSLPALINLATLPFFYLLARRVFKETLAALAACFIFGFSAYLVGYSQEARMYPLVLLFSVLSMLFFVAMEQGGDWRSHVGFILASVLGLYTHYYFAFLICFQIVYWFFYGGVRFRAFFLDLCAIGLGFIPWLPMLLYQIGQKDHSDLWIRSQSPGATQLGQALLQGASVVTRFAAGENFTYPGRQEDWHKVLVVVLAIAAAALMQRPGLAMRSYNKLLWLWLLLPLLGGFLADLFFRTRTLEMSKYFIACYPALPMILASSIVHFRWQKARMLLLAALTLLNGYGLSIYYRVPTTVEWREVAAYLSSRIEPGDRVLSPEPRVYTCVRFYLDREIQFVRVPYDARTADVVRRARDGARSASRLWMISIDETFTPKLQGLSRQLESEFSLVSRQVISGHAVVSSFANRARALALP